MKKIKFSFFIVFLMTLIASCSTPKKVAGTTRHSHVYNKNRNEANFSGNFLTSKRNVQKKFFVSKRKDKFFCLKFSNRKLSEVK